MSGRKAVAVALAVCVIFGSLVAALIIGGTNAVVVFVIGYGCGVTVACMVADGFDLLARPDRSAGER